MYITIVLCGTTTIKHSPFALFCCEASISKNETMHKQGITVGFLKKTGVLPAIHRELWLHFSNGHRSKTVYFWNLLHAWQFRIVFQNDWVYLNEHSTLRSRDCYERSHHSQVWFRVSPGPDRPGSSLIGLEFRRVQFVGARWLHVCHLRVNKLP